MQFYTTEKLGPKQELTPEGYLLCRDVPLARTGMMIYGPDETPIETGPDGYVKIFRDPEEVFNPRTIASAQGKPVVNDHPTGDEDVGPSNWSKLSAGVGINVRRGEYPQDDLLFGDLLITTPEAIKAVQDGKREISLGYDAVYEETEPGVGKQKDIVINHIALVESGRCGPRCAIGDSVFKPEKQMKKPTYWERLQNAFKAKDEDGFNAALEEAQSEGPDGDTHIHVHAGGGPASGGGMANGTDADPDPNMGMDPAIEARFKSLEDGHAAILAKLDAMGAQATPAGDGDPDPEMLEEMDDEMPEELKKNVAKATDSMYFTDSFQSVAAMAEILVPGIRIPVFDSRAKPKDTLKQICGLRRQALDLAWANPEGRAVLEDVLNGKTLDTKTADCRTVRQVFNTAAAVRKAANKQAGNVHASAHDGGQGTKPRSLAEINKLNRERYAAKK